MTLNAVCQLAPRTNTRVEVRPLRPSLSSHGHADASFDFHVPRCAPGHGGGKGCGSAHDDPSRSAGESYTGDVEAGDGTVDKGIAVVAVVEDGPGAWIGKDVAVEEGEAFGGGERGEEAVNGLVEGVGVGFEGFHGGMEVVPW